MNTTTSRDCSQGDKEIYEIALNFLRDRNRLSLKAMALEKEIKRLRSLLNK